MIQDYEPIDLREIFTPEVIARIEPTLISEQILGVQPMTEWNGERRVGKTEETK